MLQGDTYTSIFKTLLSSQLEGIMDTEARETRERYVQWEKKRREDARLTAARTSKKAEMKKASDVLAKKNGDEEINDWIEFSRTQRKPGAG
jgi:hypothetical protein